MHRNAVSIGLLSLLLGIAGFAWTAPRSFVDGASVANERPAATASTILRQATKSTRRIIVPSARKKRRVALAAAAIPLPKPAPVALIHPAVDQPTITDTHKKLMTAALNALPASCRDNLKNFSILYTGATRRGLGGKTTIILDGSVPDSELVALLIHECGHVIAGNLVGSATSGDSGYRDGNIIYYNDSPMVAFWNISWEPNGTKKKGMTDTAFVSRYSKSNHHEDFAESLTAYVSQRDMMQAQAKDNASVTAKLAWMETYLPLAEDAVGDGLATWTGTVPWDITKLAFAL